MSILSAHPSVGLSAIGNERVFCKTADTIKMPFGLVGRVDPGYHVLDLGSPLPVKCDVSGQCISGDVASS